MSEIRRKQEKEIELHSNYNPALHLERGFTIHVLLNNIMRKSDYSIAELGSPTFYAPISKV